ncbi:hypothetical protein ColTof4_02467 [Colletotrichum tofieldiae]|nr:hypothetical protein ColTof3_09244 [Colletotrichum tofieldiae]GKT70044.1 hypothetical protein ColTof4_02467 [Colletotrichum tofieldiae]
MSRLGGIAGLSFTCSIMRRISFGRGFGRGGVSTSGRVHDDGSPEPGLAEHAKSPKDVLDGLRQLLKKRPAPAPATTKAPTIEKRLVEPASKCVREA